MSDIRSPTAKLCFTATLYQNVVLPFARARAIDQGMDILMRPAGAILAFVVLNIVPKCFPQQIRELVQKLLFH